MSSLDPWSWIRAARDLAWDDVEHQDYDENGSPAGARRLTHMEASVVVFLATYADERGICNPTIPRLANDLGLKRKRKSGGYNTAISDALAGLQRLKLIWRTQAGRGHAATTKLLFSPSVTAEGKEGRDERLQAFRQGGTFRDGGSSPSATADAEVPANAQGNNRNEQQQPPEDAFRTGGRRQLSPRKEHRRSLPRSLGAAIADAGLVDGAGPEVPEDERRGLELAERLVDEGVLEWVA